MTITDFFERLKTHYTNKLPFVTYRKAYDNSLKALFQSSNEVFYIADYNSDSGFVMAPFDNNNKAILIPANKAEYIELDYKTSDIKLSASKNILEANDDDALVAQRKAHRKLVKAGRKLTRVGILDKVVLSRKETVELDEVEPIEIFKRLLTNYRDAFVYLWFHPKVGLWLGATPETLLNLNGRHLKTMSLAGTQDYIDFSLVVWGAKEREEQQIVTDYITDRLSGNVVDLRVGQTETIQAGNLLHLQTEISAMLKEDEVDLKGIIEALHPTPAICGLPRDKAKQFILENEGYNRKFYSGFLGELNIKKAVSRNQNTRNIENSAYQSIKTQSDLFVNLRCIEIINNKVHLYVGGGITSDSVSKYEYRETVSKAETMKKVL